MKIHGDIVFQSAAAPILFSESSLPSTAVAGQIAFYNKKVWACVEVIIGVPTWIPLTNEINFFVHTQGDLSNSWAVNHGLNSSNVIVQVYDGTNFLLIPGDVSIVDANNLTITLGTAITGKAVVFSGEIV